eukprot:CAMPEP_0117461742 /NCGR_PEP_ID=MMETSP0784-20121206/2685_1 /TAXON_ID=39447 /ORGANISM="" /LENGTH=110 /DNA_ID=CAMNT_0005255465 /DNA_START=727 /DNA_END=1059 /DNA_ORIENTATION=-
MTAFGILNNGLAYVVPEAGSIDLHRQVTRGSNTSHLLPSLTKRSNFYAVQAHTAMTPDPVKKLQHGIISTSTARHRVHCPRPYAANTRNACQPSKYYIPAPSRGLSCPRD